MRPIVILLAILSLKGFRSCNINICMVWILRHNQLNLRCKVNFLEYTVTLLNPLGREEAHCFLQIPTSYCQAHNNISKIYQNLETNETVLILPNAQKKYYNGNWTCLHGTGRDSAIIEISTLSTDDGIITDEGESCFLQFLSWMMVGFMSSFLVIRAIIWATDCVSEGKVEMLLQDLMIVKERRKLISSIKCQNMKLSGRNVYVHFYKRITFLLLLVIFFGTSFIGFWKNITCTAPEGFIAVGILIGILINAIISSNRGANNTANNNANQPML